MNVKIFRGLNQIIYEQKIRESKEGMSMEHRSIFRKKSMEAISSPEQLNEYIRVANPGIWVVLAAVLALLVGICVWGVMGRLDTTIRVAAVSDGKHLTCYVKEQDAESLKTGMELKLKGTETFECRITDISAQPITVDDTFDEYTVHVGQFDRGL